MKSVRNLYVKVCRFAWRCKMVSLVTALVAASLLLGGLADWLGYNASFCYLVGAVGVVWLGWYWLQIAEGITSTTKRVKKSTITSPPHWDDERKWGANALIDELRETLGKQLADYSSRHLADEKQIRDLQIQIQLSQRQKRNAEAIIYSIRDAVIVVDEFDKLLMANEAADKLFSFDFKNSQHQPINNLIKPDENEFVDFLRQSRQGKVRHTRREFNFSKDDKIRTYDCIVSCVHDQRGQVCGVVAVLHDITREKEISQMKNDFVSHVSHELKTPLASITAYSEMLVDGEANDEKTRQEFYSVIQSQANRLNRLIEDILNISRIESGMIKVNKEPVSLTILIEEQLQMIKSRAQEKGIKIISQKPIVFDQVYADRDMISQVIINLLSNAVKYTRSGGSIRIETAVDSIDNTVRVSVSDTGVGIPKNELEHVFDKFYRVDANKNDAKGTGLGLNLVKQIIEKVHNGLVFVRSEAGLGSTFGFELPLARSEAVRL